MYRIEHKRSTRRRREPVDVIAGPSDSLCPAKFFSGHPGHVCVELFADSVGDYRLAVPGAEDNVSEQVGKRVPHGVSLD